jgi:hypothetical protein
VGFFGRVFLGFIGRVFLGGFFIANPAMISMLTSLEEKKGEETCVQAMGCLAPAILPHHFRQMLRNSHKKQGMDAAARIAALYFCLV